jgi:fucose 4-O-acetylase-like acetyltransferase
LKLNIVPVCLLFYVLGSIFKQFHDKYNEIIRSKRKMLFFPAFLFLSMNILFGVVLNKRISFTDADFGNVFYCCLAAISGVLFYLILFENVRLLRTNKLLSYLGKNSLIIMATQYWFFTLYDVISKRLLNGSIWHYRNTLKALVISVITITLICSIVELLKKISVRNFRLRKICTWFGISISNQ